tara:strand:- start:5930 stop:6490 length:561 start_codon:yes stop_codon:yes gene_type:complete
MGAGILPISFNRGNILVLLGQERYSKLWCDFGGSPNKGESYMDTAIREGEEETSGFLGRGKFLYNLIKNNLIGSFNNGDKYVSFLFKIKYDSKLPHYFNNNNLFLEKKLKYEIEKSQETHNGLFEKTKMKWFTLDEINRDYTIFRPHYIPILKTIIDNEDKIIDKFSEYTRPTNTVTRRRGRHNRK